jgi:hypothetical protein
MRLDNLRYHDLGTIDTERKREAFDDLGELRLGLVQHLDAIGKGHLALACLVACLVEGVRLGQGGADRP